MIHHSYACVPQLHSRNKRLAMQVLRLSSKLALQEERTHELQRRLHERELSEGMPEASDKLVGMLDVDGAESARQADTNEETTLVNPSGSPVCATAGGSDAFPQEVVTTLAAERSQFMQDFFDGGGSASACADGLHQRMLINLPADSEPEEVVRVMRQYMLDGERMLRAARGCLHVTLKAEPKTSRAGYLRSLTEMIGLPPKERTWQDEWAQLWREANCDAGPAQTIEQVCTPTVLCTGRCRALPCSGLR